MVENVYDKERLGKIYSAIPVTADLMKINDDWLLSNSFLYRLFKTLKYEHKKNNTKTKYLEEIEDIHFANKYLTGSYVNEQCKHPNCVEEISDLWINNTFNLHHLLKQNKIQFISILQPNHYIVDDVIKISKHDQDLMDPSFGWDIYMTKSWNKIQNRMRNQDVVNFFDLSDPYIFDAKTNSLVDGCCHLTQEGNDRVARKLNLILESMIQLD